MVKKIGRPKEGKQVKKVYSVRVEPRIYNKLIKKYGTLSKALLALHDWDLGEKE